MTLITRLAGAVLSFLLAAGLVAATSSAPASAKPAIDPLTQHVHVTAHTTAGMRRDPIFYGSWDVDAGKLPKLGLQGANQMAWTTRFEADSPAPGLRLRHARGYCVVQHYGVRTLDPATASASYNTTVTVRRRSHVVFSHTSHGTYRSSASPTGDAPAPLTTVRDGARFGHLRLGRHDRVRWTIRGTLVNQIKKFHVSATIAPHC